MKHGPEPSTGRHKAIALSILSLLLAAVGCTGIEGTPGERGAFERVDVDAGAPTNTLLASDRNGDGVLDLVVAGGERVAVLRGLGDGRFDFVSTLDGGEHPADLSLGDVDGDGIEDLAVANHDTRYVTVLFALPDGGFAARAESRVPADVAPHPHAVLLDDVDGDGHVDLLVDDRGAEAVRFFPGAGDGTFSGSHRIGVGGDPYRGMVLADANGDGHPDLVTPNPDRVAILVGDGRGGFGPPVTLAPGFAPFSAVVADVDGDGIADVAAASGEGPGRLAVWTGSGGGAFEAPATYEIAQGPARLAAADLDGDGADELLVASYVGDGVAVLWGGASPTLRRIDLNGSPYGFATGDFDGDGTLDFAVARDESDRIAVFLSRG
jgi:hypothetical protein